MEIILGLIFICLVLVAGALLAFGYSVHAGDHEQAERMSLMPLESEEQLQEKKE
ncbi:MAG: cytochrome oxidase [Myxococcales bacterium]